MKIEHWALVVSFLALMASIGIPVWQFRASRAQARAARRSLLLQTILTAKSTTFVSLHELVYLIRKHGDKMEEGQRANLEAMVPRMRAHHDDLEKLHAAWSNFNDGASMQDMETELTGADVVASEAADTARLVENGRRSYEGA